MIRLFLTLCLALAPALTRAAEITAGALDALPQAQVYVLGEVHDNPAHHRNQAQAISALRPAALVWEMLTEEQATRMPADRSDPREVEEALGWADTGWPEYALYHPVVEAAGNARHYGAGIPRHAAREAFVAGAAAVFGADAGRFGLDRPLPDDEQAQREAAQFDAHCQAMPLELMGGMVEAQRLRDAALARAVLTALAETGGPVAVITGSGHARTDWGMPALLSPAAPGVSVLAVGQVESDPGPDAPWDLWLITEPHPRGDPCEAFR